MYFQTVAIEEGNTYRIEVETITDVQGDVATVAAQTSISLQPPGTVQFDLTLNTTREICRGMYIVWCIDSQYIIDSLWSVWAVPILKIQCANSMVYVTRKVTCWICSPSFAQRQLLSPEYALAGRFTTTSEPAELT